MSYKSLTQSRIDDFWDQGFLEIGRLLDDDLAASLSSDQPRRAFAIHFMPTGIQRLVPDLDDESGERRIPVHVAVSFSRPMLRANL